MSYVSRAAVGVKQIMHPAAEDKSLLGLLRSFVCSQGQNKETHHTLKKWMWETLNLAAVEK